ncbi:MAG: long-chain fatty acid--CoA ligase [Acidimicrobiales bacterium]|nr:long-chain fatty acid--CoA ligase [Acidimicrobiales bacterium]
MKSFTGPKLTVTPKPHLVQILSDAVAADPGAAIAASRDGDSFRDVSSKDFQDRVRAVAQGLIASGVAAGDRVALMSATRMEWAIADFAIMSAGAVTVPIYDSSSAEQVAWIVGNSESVLTLVETDAMATEFDSVASGLSSCRERLVIEGGALDTLIARGAEVPESEVEARIAGITPDSLATVIYTSGTTGRPKGCMLTHRNLATNVAQGVSATDDMFQDGDSALIFLPLAHILTKTTFLFCLQRGVRVIFATDVAHLAEELKMASPEFMSAVPRIFEKIYNGAQKKAYDEGKGKIFDRAADVAIAYSRQKQSGSVSLPIKIQHAIFNKLVYSKLAAAFGGKMRVAVSGGGPLGERLCSFFDGVGVKIYEGYGLTETSPTLTINTAKAWRPGTVGMPSADTEIRIAEDGEIQAKGPQVFSGYWKNPEATAEVFDDGWFATGDIGEIDPDGFVKITGRKKELIVTAGGKNVAPAPLEDRLRAHPLISQAMVVGDNQPFIACLIAIDADSFPGWVKSNDLGDLSMADAADNEALRAEVQSAIDEANKSVSKAESIRKFAILPSDLSIENGELTPTLKVKRMVVADHYKQQLDALYSS